MDDFNTNYEEIHIPFTANYDFQGFEIFEAKFSNLTTLQQKVYDPAKYKIEEKIKVKNDKGEEVEKDIPVSSYIRFKYIDNPEHKPEDNSQNLEKNFGLQHSNSNN